MNKQECIKALMILEKWFPNFKVLGDDTLLEGWTKRLEVYTPVEVKQAIEMIVDNETYPPTPAVMKKYIDQLAGNDSNEIVHIFKKACSRYGLSYRYQEAVDYIKSQSDIAYEILVREIGLKSLSIMTPEDAAKKIHRVFSEKRAVMSSNVAKIAESTQGNQQISLMSEGLKRI